MIAVFEDEIHRRIDAIEGALAPAESNEDTKRFLAAVRGASGDTIRQAPVAAQRALAKTRNPEIGINQLVMVIEEDPTLGQALLRYANSAYYAVRGGDVVVSLKHAAQRVGTTGVRNVVLAGMLDGMLCRPGASYQTMVDLVRGHMVRTAPIARSIARGFAVPPDEAFALGLLHDVGKLIVFDAIGTMRHELRRDLSIVPSVVHTVLMQLHEPLGGLAALRWGLGEPVAHAIATHHRTPVPETTDRMSEVLFVAEHVEHALMGVRPMALETWWQAGAIGGQPTRVSELIALYTETEAIAA